jgi:hypothetical protein
VVNLKTIRTASTIVVIEAVALREEILERTIGRGERVTRRSVHGVERRVSRSACAPIVHAGITAVHAHDRGMVRQVE